MRPRKQLRGLLLLTTALASGCQAGYVLEQGFHHIQLAGRAKPLGSPEVARAVTPAQMEKLRWVPRVLEFSKSELGLDPGDSYLEYLDTGGTPLSWAVTASPPLALLPYRWSFPFVGEVPYKGYFDEEDARAEADRLRAAGYEAMVLPVAAFSTLGWFEDPVTSGMLEGSLAGLVDLLIHETTHRTLYFPGASSFNESLATHVAREGTSRFLGSHDELRGLLPAYLEGRYGASEREALLLRLRSDLDALYRSPVPPEAMIERKREVFRTADAAARRLHPGAGSVPASNPYILSVARYHEFEPLLRRLQQAVGGEPSKLVERLKSLPPSADPARAIEDSLRAGSDARGP